MSTSFQSTTRELWIESQQIKLTLDRPDAAPTTLVLTIAWPTGFTVIDGFVITLSDKFLDHENYPIDGVRYTPSTDLNLPADLIDNVQVVAAQYGAFNTFDPLAPTATITITNVDPNKLYYASLHGASNVLQYYPLGVQSYPLETAPIAKRNESYAGSIPQNEGPPTSPTLGQLYYDVLTNTVQLWNGAIWLPASTNTPIVGPVSKRPTAPAAGDFFYNETIRRLEMWNGTAWQFADTEQPGTPMYDKVPIGTDGSYDERAKLASVLKVQLGYPALCVELSEDSFNVAIDNALEEFRRRADNAYKMRYIIMTTVPYQQKYYLNDPRIGTDRVVSVQKIHRLNLLGMSIYTSDNAVYLQTFLNQVYQSSGFDLVSLHLTYSLAEEFQRLFAGDLAFTWDEASRELFIHRTNQREEKVILEVSIERTEQELLTDRYAKQWIQGWAHAEAKEMLGMIRSKFGTLPGAGGGVTLNGDTLLAEARTDFEELLRQITDYEVGNGGVDFLNCAIMIG